MLPARLFPALVEEVGVERPDLRKLQLLVPPDMAVGTALYQVLAPFRLLRIDQHDSVVALFHRASAFCHAGRVVTVIAHGRDVGDIDHRDLPTLLLQDIDPLVAVFRHRCGIARPAIADIFVHDRERAQIAIRALRDVNDHVPFLHGVPPPVILAPSCADLTRAPILPRRRWIAGSCPVMTRWGAARAANYFAGTSCAAFSVSRTSLSFSIRAKVSDMCSMRPSQSST